MNRHKPLKYFSVSILLNSEILTRSEKDFHQTELMFIRKAYRTQMFDEVPLLVSPKGDIFLCYVDLPNKTEVRWTIDGVKEDGDLLAFTRKMTVRPIDFN